MGAPVVYVAGRLCRLLPWCRPLLARWLALGVLVVSGGFWWATWQAFTLNGSHRFLIGTIPLQLDGVTVLVSAVVLLLTTLVTIFSISYMAGETGESKYYAMLLALAGVMMGLASAADLFNLWLWFEAMAVTSYLLVAFYREQPASLEAGVKYLVQSATGSVLVLIGIALLLAQTGTLELAEIKNVLVTSCPASAVWPSCRLATLAAMALFVIGFGVKAALVPLHTWLPDAHAQAPSGISAMLSGVVIEVGLVAMLRVVGGVADSAVFGTLLLVFAAANMLLGNLLALRQTQVKRLLAFSSLSHMGYILLGLGITFYSGQTAGAQGSFFHLLTHAIMKGLAFLAVGALMVGKQTSGDHSHLHVSPMTRDDLAGVARQYPVVALALTLALLGLAGLPPLAGFMSKWQILTAGVATLNSSLIALAVFAALNSVLSLVYYAPLVNMMYRRPPAAALAAARPLPMSVVLPVVVLGTAVLLLGFWPGLGQWLAEPAAMALEKQFSLLVLTQ